MSERNPMFPVKGCCAKCLAFDALGSSCRRRAPVAVPMQGIDPVSRQAQLVGVSGVFPATKAENWCLDFVEEETKLEISQ